MRSYLTVLLVLVALFGAPTDSFAQARQGYYYTVQKAESLATIARRFGMSEAELARENRMARGAKLARGSRLWIPRRPPSASSAPKTIARPVAVKPAPSKQTTTKPAPKPAASKPAPSTVTPRDFSPAETGGSTYVVRRGDSLWGVASKHGLTVAELARLNGISSSSSLEVGQRLVVTKSSDEIPGGGVKAPEAAPVVSRPDPEPAPVSSGSGSTKPSSRGYIWPIEGRILRSYVNRADEKYTGIDIAAPRGSEVRAAREGRVLYAGDGIPAYGNLVIVQHDNDTATCYAQLDRVLVKKDQAVRRGQVIGRSGDPGRGREPYLHFEIRRGGEAVDPEPYLP